MLDKFRIAKQEEIKALHEEFMEGRIPAVYEGTRPGFAEAIRAKGPGAVIAEFKPASPSKGTLREHANPLDFVEAYAANGAAAMSVLTESHYFKGHPDYLFMCADRGLPILRKDFIIDPLQVAMTASSPASAVLLIARMFGSSHELRQMVQLAEAAGLEPVTEVFDESDLDSAREAGAKIIQVNNRDLNTLTTTLDISRRLMDKQDGELWISASGVDSRPQIEEMAALGFDAVLIGTSLMLADDPGAMLAQLTGADK